MELFCFCYCHSLCWCCKIYMILEINWTNKLEHQWCRSSYLQPQQLELNTLPLEDPTNSQVLMYSSSVFWLTKKKKNANVFESHSKSLTKNHWQAVQVHSCLTLIGRSVKHFATFHKMEPMIQITLLNIILFMTNHQNYKTESTGACSLQNFI